VSDLANNIQGEHFTLPATAAFWRVRRLKEGRGAPEVVFGADGVPLLVAVETDFEAFRGAVDDQPGRYRLDALDEARRPIEGVPAAYVAVPMRVGRVPAEPSAEAPPPVAPAYGHAAAVPSPVGAHDALLAEVIRGQNQLVALMTERFSGIMVSAAELLRVFPHQVLTAPLTPPTPPLPPPPSFPTPGGPGPRNAGSYDPTELEPEVADSDDPEADDDGAPAPPESGLVATMTAVNNIVGEVMPVVKLFMAHRMAKDSPRSAPRNAAPLAAAPAPAPLDPAAPPEPPCGPMSLAELRHLDAIDAALTPGEARRHQLVTDDLPATDRRAWFDTLCSLDVPDAVALIRRHIARAQRMVPGRPIIPADADLDIDAPSADGDPITQESPAEAPITPIETNVNPDRSTAEPPNAPSDLPCAHRGEATTACACGEPLVITPDMIAHALAVQAALTPAESARVLVLAGDMPNDERDAWMADLSTFTVADAVQAVREALANLDGAPVSDRMGPLLASGRSDSTAPFPALPAPASLPVDTATARSHPAPAPRTSAVTSVAHAAPGAPDTP
jgi:hypothetical protein